MLRDLKRGSCGLKTPLASNRDTLVDIKLTLAQLRLIDIPQLVDIRALSGNYTLRKLDKPTNSRPLRSRILRRKSSNLDSADSRVVRSAVVLAVAEVSDPRLERRAVVLVDELAVGDDFGLA